MGRVATTTSEDIRFLQGMNRLRHAYHETVPGLEPYFITGHYDDVLGIFANYGADVRSRDLAIDRARLHDRHRDAGGDQRLAHRGRRSGCWRSWSSGRDAEAVAIGVVAFLMVADDERVLGHARHRGDRGGPQSPVPQSRRLSGRGPARVGHPVGQGFPYRSGHGRLHGVPDREPGWVAVLPGVRARARQPGASKPRRRGAVGGPARGAQGRQRPVLRPRRLHRDVRGGRPRGRRPRARGLRPDGTLRDRRPRRRRREVHRRRGRRGIRRPRDARGRRAARGPGRPRHLRRRGGLQALGGTTLRLRVGVNTGEALVRLDVRRSPANGS